MFSAPVTAIKILPNDSICLAGTGPYVLAFDLTTNEQLFQTKILTDSIVHGFEARQMTQQNHESSYIIVVFGQRTFSLVQWSSTNRTSLTPVTSLLPCPSWILSALIVDRDPSIESLTILFGTALNQIYRYETKSSGAENSLTLIQSFKYTTLYSSCLFRHTDESIWFAAGTVFGELILCEQDASGEFHEKSTVSDHNGAIFGITYHRNRLCTVGDDRTAKFYEFDRSLRLIFSFFAHEARIWQSSITSTHLLTCGEDSSIRFWSQKTSGELLRCFSVHRCKSCWSMDILRDENDDKPLVIVSGWSDGAVRRYHLDDVPYDSHEPISLTSILNNDFVRNAIFLNDKSLLVHMHSGHLLKIEQFQSQRTVSIFFDGRETLKNAYAKMVVAKEGEQLIAVGSLDGQVLIFDQMALKRHQFQIDFNRNNKILQLFWLNNTLASKLLICLPDGLMFIYQITAEQVTIVHRLEPLPEFEQRWPNTCLYLQENDLFLVGDRQGNLLSYDLRPNDANSICSIHQQFPRLHGINGTSSIDMDLQNNVIRTCGRDGYINIFSLDSQQRQLIHQTTLTISSDITWLDLLINQPLLITCFTTNHFSLYTYDEQTKRRLMQVECGGGHRNNDFFIDQYQQAFFVYVRNKQVYLARKHLRRILNEANCLSRIPPTHGTEIRSIKLFENNEHLHFITGGEDTQMKLFRMKIEGSQSSCEHISTLQSHLSAVCDMMIIDQLIFSCGARAQLFAWQIKSNLVVRSGQFMLHPLRRRHGGGGGGNLTDESKKDTSDDDHGLDVRFTSVAAMAISETGIFLVFVTGSDAVLRVFRYTSGSNRFALLQTCSHSEYCQLRVKVLQSKALTFVSSTDGLICAQDFSSLANSIRSSTWKIHQSGINDFDLISMNDRENFVRLVSVGDDGSMHVSLFDISQWSWTREYSQDFTHQSPATGIRFFTSTTFVSIGIDQRLKLWMINNDQQSLELKQIHLVDIRDILSMDMIFSEKKGQYLIAIAGAGVQTIEFDPMENVFHSSL